MIKVVKRSRKFDKYQDLARQLKTLWHMNVTTITSEVGTLGLLIINV